MEKVVLSSLYDRIGGKKALDAAVDIFYDKVLADESIRHFFESTDMTRQRKKLQTFLAMALGAPVKYTGKDLRLVHAHLVEKGLNKVHFGTVATHLEDTLKQLKVPVKLIKEVMQIVASTQNNVLGINENKINEAKQIQKMTKTKNPANGNGTLATEKNGKGYADAIQDIDFMQVLEGSILCVVMINEAGTIEYFNTAAEKLWGYSREEVMGENVKMLTPKNIQPEHDSYLSNYRRTGKKNVMGSSREVKALRKDGTLVDVLLSLSESEMEGRRVYTAFVQDITEKKNLEREGQQAMEELRAQEEEIRQNMEEMQATQEEMERRQVEMNGQMEAINSTSAFIEFELDGTVVTANDLFLQTMQYELEEIKGHHHRMFVENTYAKSREYQKFWDDLRAGNPQTGEFQRIAKNGSSVWLLANYTPVKNQNGEVIKVIKLASNITEEKRKNADYQGQIDAISKSQAVIEFNLDGTIITANDNFLKTVGYSLSEIQGKHHRMFVEEAHKNSSEYQEFWNKLNEGQFETGEFKRIGKGGKEVYIQATYNPIFDTNGVPFKVVKYATDITEFTRALKAVSTFVGQLREGDFDADITISSDGDIGQMIKDNLELRDTLKQIINDVNGVVKKAGNEGDLNARLNLTETKGSWKLLVDSINLLLQSIADPMLEFNTIISEMANGDLTKKFEMQAEGDILNMAESLNTAVENLNNLLSTIGENSDVVANSSMNMLEKSESMKRNTNEVASAIAQMARGAQDQAARTDESSKLVNEVLTISENMESKANIINLAAEKGQESCEEGLKIINRLVENMTGISDSANLTSESIKILTQRAEEIGRTLNVITDIAAQTNLLALNAAIEAARAGDAGRGFAVVAEEIRKLAEDSRKSAVDIEKIIGDVQKDTQSAGKAIENMSGSVKEGNKASKEAEAIFQEIAKSSQETLSYSKEIQEATAGQKGSIDTVVKNIEQIVVVAEETAAGTQEVASSSQELNTSMEEITMSSNQLSEIAAELQAGVNQFKLVASDKRVKV